MCLKYTGWHVDKERGHSRDIPLVHLSCSIELPISSDFLYLPIVAFPNAKGNILSSGEVFLSKFTDCYYNRLHLDIGDRQSAL
jgi:hypothetical protein